MLQEIITYLIVVVAIVVAVIKVLKRFKKKKPQKHNFNKVKLTNEHNCTECAAACALRDMPKPIISSRQDECTTNYHSKQDQKDLNRSNLKSL